MNTCAHIVRGAAARLHARAANDNAAIRSLMRSIMMQSRLGLPAREVLAAFAMDRELFRLHQQTSARPCQHGDSAYDGAYDDLLGRVGAEMAQPGG
jgi:hypothetical protein